MNLAVVFLLIASIGAMGYGQPPKRKEPAVTLCGRKLAIAHHLICSSLDGSNNDKRNALSNEFDYGWVLEDYPWTGRRDALNARWSRNKRLVLGLADECCLKPCTTEEIENYC